MRESCLILFLHLLIFTSCEVDRRKGESTNIAYEQDSLKIARAFEAMLAHDQNTDSLIDAIGTIAQKHAGIHEIYHFHLAKLYIQTGKILQADSVINIVLAAYTGKDSLYYAAAKFYNLKAAIAAYQHHQELSIAYYQKAISIFEKYNDYRQLAVIQFNLANTFFSRMDYASVYKYINKAKDNFIKVEEHAFMPLVEGIMAIAAIKLNNAEEGQVLAANALKNSIHNQHHLGEILAHYAMGEYFLFYDSFRVAHKHFAEAQELSTTYKLQNLSLPIQAALLNTYLGMNKTQEAIATGNNALALARAANNKEIQYNLNKNLAEAYAQEANTSMAYQHLKAAESIFRNNALDNNQEVLQKLLIEYETEKKNNVILQQQNELNQQRILIISFGALAVISLLLLLSFRRNLRQKSAIAQRSKALEVAQALTQGEEKERIRLANELHDGIASNLVALKMQIEVAENYSQKAEHISLVKKTHQEVRKVAQNLMPIDFRQVSLDKALAQFCADMHSSKTAVHFTGSFDARHLPQNDVLILYRCVQELVQNAMKHADAQNITVQLFDDAQGLRINVEDDGKGFDILNLQHLGVFKYRQRLQQIGATFELDSSKDKGTIIFISYKPYEA